MHHDCTTNFGMANFIRSKILIPLYSQTNTNTHTPNGFGLAEKEKARKWCSCKTQVFNWWYSNYCLLNLQKPEKFTRLARSKLLVGKKKTHANCVQHRNWSGKLNERDSRSHLDGESNELALGSILGALCAQWTQPKRVLFCIYISFPLCVLLFYTNSLYQPCCRIVAELRSSWLFFSATNYTKLISTKLNWT